MPSTEARLTLPDGRILSYASHGPTAGRPVLYFHGTPASKRNWYLNHDPRTLHDLQLRILAVDRPGIGGSSPQPNRTLLQWTDDVRHLADALELPRFAVLGYSCGSPYALACALHLGERVTHTTIVSGMVDLTHPDLRAFPPQQNHRVLQMAVAKPRASRLVYRMMNLSATYLPNVMIQQALSTMPPADREVISQPDVKREFLAMLHETFRQGPRGAQHDSALVASPWNLDLDALRGPVRLWHGDQDRNVPLELGRHLARRLPNAHLTVVPEEGHLSLIHRHQRAILNAIVHPNAS